MTSLDNFLKQSPLYPAIVLETYFSRRKRSIASRIAKYIILALPIIIIITALFVDTSNIAIEKEVDFLVSRLVGLVLFALGTYLAMQAFEAYFASVYYFEYVSQNNYSEKELYTFSAGRILRKVKNDNLLSGLLNSSGVGQKLLWRLGISEDEIATLKEKQKKSTNHTLFDLSGKKLIKVSDIVDCIYNNYPDFKKVLDNHGINKNELDEALAWVIYDIESFEYKRKWWTKERLARIPGVGTDWSFGRTYLLNKFSRNVAEDPEVNSDAVSFEGRTRELSQIQTTLERSTGSNVILVGQPGQEKMEVIWNLARQIKEQTVSPSLKGKKPILFLATKFTSTIKNKDEFEEKLPLIFSEALKAGDIILIIDNLPRLILQAKQFDLNLNEIIEPYLSGVGGRIIALAETEFFHSLIENDKALMASFETVLTRPLEHKEIVEIIGREALDIEKNYHLVITYPAITQIAKSAEYYFPDGVSADKAKDLLAELAPWTLEKGKKIIDKDLVNLYISEKTNIPTSTITETEKNTLLNLETLLMKRVIAQREAVFAISSAIRRSRAGIRNENRPIGSFLFLGPTGVGKTETAKALADIFFGDEKKMQRLDMSEYQTEEALIRLIGSIENNNQGLLAKMLREQPYGVLLLDEFEKTDKKVLNLFLQILDEGFFTDAFGKKIMARQTIFIATSNAGAEKIFDLVNKGENLENHQDDIVAEIVKNGILKPELINRFDGTIVFHPLTKENLAQIATLMIKKVIRRLNEKGMNMEFDQELVNFLAENGYNPTFGARPMNRLIQDTIEEHLSNLIIRQELVPGKTVKFKVLDMIGNKNSLKTVVI